MRASKLDLPRFIACVGNPKAGKDAVKLILNKQYGTTPIDSGLPLRKIAMEHYGLTPWHVFTQDGKAEFVEILGRKWQVRELLGELGNRFEEMHGDWATPWMETRKISAKDPGPFVDASCRKSQGAFYKTIGGVVIGVRRPGCKPSPYEFDRVREEHVDEWIDNDGTLLDLSKKVDTLMSLLARYRAR
jgi:hypothetical protein